MSRPVIASMSAKSTSAMRWVRAYRDFSAITALLVAVRIAGWDTGRGFIRKGRGNGGRDVARR